MRKVHINNKLSLKQRRGGEPGCDYKARFETQRPERDENEDVKQRRRLEVERGRLLVLDVEAPYQAKQQGPPHEGTQGGGRAG